MQVVLPVYAQELTIVDSVIEGVGVLEEVASDRSTDVPEDVNSNEIIRVPDEIAPGGISEPNENFLERESGEVNGSALSEDDEADAEADEEDADAEAEAEKDYYLLEEIDFPAIGDQYGWIRCERIGFEVSAYWDDTDAILDLGAGTSLAGYLPGFGGPIILSGHTMTHFSPLAYMEVGDIISFETTYGSYEYEITDITVYNENDLLDLLLEKTGYEEEEESSIEDDTIEETNKDGTIADSDEDDTITEINEDGLEEELSKEIIAVEQKTNVDAEGVIADEPQLVEEIILYTCYPFYLIDTRKTDRYTVIARKLSGPEIRWQIEEQRDKNEDDKTEVYTPDDVNVH